AAARGEEHAVTALPAADLGGARAWREELPDRGGELGRLGTQDVFVGGTLVFARPRAVRHGEHATGPCSMISSRAIRSLFQCSRACRAPSSGERRRRARARTIRGTAGRMVPKGGLEPPRVAPPAPQ